MYPGLARAAQDESHHLGRTRGVGFLAARVILRDPGKHHVNGLTTAATIWPTALLAASRGAGVPADRGCIVLTGQVVIGGLSARAVQRRFFPKVGDAAERMTGKHDD